MSKSHLLYYNAIHAFKYLYYGPLLRPEHLVQRSQIRIGKFFIPGEPDPIEYDFWGYHLMKDGQNFLISSTNGDGEEININELLPIEVKHKMKVADSKGNVYFLVTQPIPMRFVPEQIFSPKEFIDNMCLLAHENPDHQKLLVFMAMSQLWDRSYYRISSEPGCVDKDTEFLTECGWKKVSEYREGDKVMQYHVETGFADLVEPIKYIKLPSEYLNLGKTKFIEMSFCDDHKFIYQNARSGNVHSCTGKEFVEYANSTLNSCERNVITSFKAVTRTKMEISDQQLRVMVAVIADGCFSYTTKNRPNKCQVQFKKQEKVCRLKELLKEANIEYSVFTYSDGYTRFKFDAPINTKVYNNNFWKCSSSQLKIIGEECLFWDGNNKDTFYTTDKNNADFIQYCFNSQGFSSNISAFDRVGTSRTAQNGQIYSYKSIEYTVQRNTKTGTSFSKGRNKDGTVNKSFTRMKTLDGYKYCFTVPSGALVLRRNGKVFVTGNCGKDSIVDICSSFYGDCGTVESPTIAKLEDRASVLKWLVVNEVVDINKAEWDTIQQFLLTAGAHKNEVTKHSRAFQNVGEIIDTSKFSLSLFYNDINCYPGKDYVLKPYFDDYTKKAVKDRFPAFRFWGKFTEDFNSMAGIDVYKFVQIPDNWKYYEGMNKSFLYYKDHYLEHMHNWNRDKLFKSDGRDATNLGKLIRVIDIYCNSQKEFDYWVNVVNQSRMDYVTMLSFSSLWQALLSKTKKDIPDEDKSEQQIRYYLNELEKVNTFEDKNNKVRDWLKGNTKDKPKEDGDIFQFGFDKIDEDIL